MTPEKQKEFREFISKYMTQPMLGNKPGTRPDGFISEDDVINKIEAYKNEEVEQVKRRNYPCDYHFSDKCRGYGSIEHPVYLSNENGFPTDILVIQHACLECDMEFDND